MLTLFHSGYEEILHPDIHRGRKNADFGQGFYTSDNREFALRWALPRKGERIVINEYRLDDSALSIKKFERDNEWFEYIFNNRRNKDTASQYDLIIGPIANDTLYDTLGIISSGYFSNEESLKMLQAGPCYEQVVIKSEKAAEAMKWVDKFILSDEEALKNVDLNNYEEKKYMQEIEKILVL